MRARLRGNWLQIRWEGKYETWEYILPHVCKPDKFSEAHDLTSSTLQTSTGLRHPLRPVPRAGPERSQRGRQPGPVVLLCPAQCRAGHQVHHQHREHAQEVVTVPGRHPTTGRKSSLPEWVRAGPLSAAATAAAATDAGQPPLRGTTSSAPPGLLHQHQLPGIKYTSDTPLCRDAAKLHSRRRCGGCGGGLG